MHNKPSVCFLCMSRVVWPRALLKVPCFLPCPRKWEQVDINTCKMYKTWHKSKSRAPCATFPPHSAPQCPINLKSQEKWVDTRCRVFYPAKQLQFWKFDSSYSSVKIPFSNLTQRQRKNILAFHMHISQSVSLSTQFCSGSRTENIVRSTTCKCSVFQIFSFIFITELL